MLPARWMATAGTSQAIHTTRKRINEFIRSKDLLESVLHTPHQDCIHHAVQPLEGQGASFIGANYSKPPNTLGILLETKLVNLKAPSMNGLFILPLQQVTACEALHQHIFSHVFSATSCVKRILAKPNGSCKHSLALHPAATENNKHHFNSDRNNIYECFA